MELELSGWGWGEISGFRNFKGQGWGTVRCLEGVKGPAELRGQRHDWLRVRLGMSWGESRGEGCSIRSGGRDGPSYFVCLDCI